MKPNSELPNVLLISQILVIQIFYIPLVADVTPNHEWRHKTAGKDPFITQHLDCGFQKNYHIYGIMTSI